MIYSSVEQFRRADIIIDAVCRVGRVAYPELVSHPRSLLYNTLRGVCCLLSWEYGVHPNKMKSLIMRSRCNVINQSKRYLHYLKTGDRITEKVYIEAKKIIEERLQQA